MSGAVPNTRLVDWERRLNAYLARIASEAHAYGTHDCLLHPANAVLAVTGFDPGAGHRGRYRSQASAVRYLTSLGFDSPSAMLDSLFEEVPIGFAQRGDLALSPPGIIVGGSSLVPANDGAGWAVPGVVTGAAALVIAEGAETGLYPVPRREWLKAWKVGR